MYRQFCDIMTFMSEKKKRNRSKKNRRNSVFYRRLTIICVEIFVLVVVAGIGVLLWLEINSRNGQEEGRAAWSEEFFIDAPGGEDGLGLETTEPERIEVPLSSGRYGNELTDEEYCRQNRIYTKDAALEDEVVLAFAGDVSFAEGYANMETLKQMGGKIEACFDERLLQEMHSADIFMINNEFTYSDRGQPLPDKEYTFRAKTENVKYLHDLGVDIVSVANNHTYDYGEVSLLDTLATLDGVQIPYVGAGRNIEEAVKPVYFIINDMKIAFVAATQIEQFDRPDTIGAGENNAGVFRCWTEERIYEVVREARENSDFVVAYMHWGTELKETLHWAQTDQAAKLVEAGADLIVGAHPHCLQEISYIDDVPVAYSLGNFWFNSKTRDTGILKVGLDLNGVKWVQFVPAIQSGCRTTSVEAEEQERILTYMRTLSAAVYIDAEGYVQR